MGWEGQSFGLLGRVVLGTWNIGIAPRPSGLPLPGCPPGTTDEDSVMGSPPASHLAECDYYPPDQVPHSTAFEISLPIPYVDNMLPLIISIFFRGIDGWVF